MTENMMDLEDAAVYAAALLGQADALLVAAGAGMGVDSGLPDFRGSKGFWQAYPVLAESKISFESMANPRWFASDPAMAWAFYGHRAQLYNATTPHLGFRLLKAWADRMSAGHFVFTSNVDGQFQKCGFSESRVLECHGSIHHLQCSVPCSRQLWEWDCSGLKVDLREFRATGDLPLCPQCGHIARPNILMFGDGQWLGLRSGESQRRFVDWTGSLQGKRLVIIECGAGTAIPSVRHTCENLANQYGASLIRINPREPDGPPGTVSMATGALEGLVRIARELGRRK